MERRGIAGGEKHNSLAMPPHSSCFSVSSFPHLLFQSLHGLAPISLPSKRYRRAAILDHIPLLVLGLVDVDREGARRQELETTTILLHQPGPHTITTTPATPALCDRTVKRIFPPVMLL